MTALADTGAGNGRLVLVGGEPGIGKSRLAEEFSMRADECGAQVLAGRCWEAGGAPAYWPWVQSLRAYAREREPALLRAELASGAAELHSWCRRCESSTRASVSRRRSARRRPLSAV